MIYALRALAVCLSVWVLVYLGTSVVVACAWKPVARLLRRSSASVLATALCALRLSPAIAATITVALFALPSFLHFEPRAAAESVGLIPALLGCACALLLAVGAAAALRALRNTRTLTRCWATDARILQQNGAVTAYETPQRGPLLAMAGMIKPAVFVSTSVTALLSPEELKRAIAHEMMHVRRRDNLAKLIVLLCRFPAMRALERAWHEAMELAADERSVYSKAEAIDLAAALVKVSRLSPRRLPDLATGFAAPASGSVPARVTRLLAWTTPAPASPHSRLIAATAIGTLMTLAFTYQPILLAMHEFTEWLVR
jgi:beta-lactamase regulating signal transducer with metallopeptidase domain